MTKSNADVVTYGGVSYRRGKFKGYCVLYEMVDGKTNWDKHVYEHRVVYETEHNVKLPSNVQIHHINHIKDDNRIENLVALTPREHRYQHVADCGGRVGPFYCVDCGAEIVSRKAKRCIECCRRLSRSNLYPTKEQLASYIQTMSNTEIAAMCGVSGRAVGKWRKRYGLPSASEQRGWHRGTKDNHSQTM